MDEELKEEFFMDMEDLLIKLETGIIGIEKDENNAESLNELFRVMHSVKGISAMMELVNIEKISHGMENILFEVRDGNIKMNSDIINLLFLSKDYLENFLEKIKNNSVESEENEKFIEEILEKISRVKKKSGRKKKIDVEDGERVSTISDEVIEKLKFKEGKYYKIKIFIEKNCQMKKMRAYMNMKVCREKFFVFAELPTIEELENEEKTFNGAELFLSTVSNEKIEFIEKQFKELPEVEDVIVEEMVLSGKNIIYNFETEKKNSMASKFVPEDFKKEFSIEIKRQINDIEKNIMLEFYNTENLNVVERELNTISGLGKMMRKVVLSSIAEESIRYIEIIKNEISNYEQNDIKGLLLNSIQLMRILEEKANDKIDDSLGFKIEYHLNLLDMAKRKKEVLNNNEFKEFIKDIDGVSLEEVQKLLLLKKNNEKKDKIENIGTVKIEQKDDEVTRVGEIRVAVNKIEKLNELISELQMIHSVAEEKNKQKSSDLNNEIAKMISITKEIQSISGAMNNLTLQVLYQKMSRVFRDSVKKTGKKAELVMTGEGTEIERAVMDKITEPMIHIIKNTVSHGIEECEERIKRGKAETGRVRIDGYLKRNYVYIEISDDGKGIDIENVYKKAYENKIALKEFNEYSEKEIIDFLFFPGFSTAEKIDEMAGRGVGMDVVKSEIDKLRGSINIESIKDNGTKVTLKIPVNSMILNGMIIEIDDKNYIIPTAYVNEIVDNINLTVTHGVNKKRYVKIRENIFEIEDISLFVNSKNKERRVMLIIEKENKKKVIEIDRVADRRDVTVTGLNINVKDKLPFLGAAILGDGRVYLILDIENIIN